MKLVLLVSTDQIRGRGVTRPGLTKLVFGHFYLGIYVFDSQNSKLLKQTQNSKLLKQTQNFSNKLSKLLNMKLLYITFCRHKLRLQTMYMHSIYTLIPPHYEIYDGKEKFAEKCFLSMMSVVELSCVL